MDGAKVFEPGISNMYQVQCLLWKVLHAFYTRFMLAEFLKDVYNALQEWGHRQGVCLNCISYKQLLPRNPNKGLSYTLAVIPGSAGVEAVHLCAVCLDGACVPLATVAEIMQRHEMALVNTLIAWNWGYTCPEMWFMRYLQALLQ